MKIPTKIKILGHTIKVSCHGNLVEHPDGDMCLGLAHQWTDKISLAVAYTDETGARQDMSEMTVAETLLHEIIHHIDNRLGLELQEYQISGIACGIIQVIRDNKMDFGEGVNERARNHQEVSGRKIKR